MWLPERPEGSEQSKHPEDAKYTRTTGCGEGDENVDE